MTPEQTATMATGMIATTLEALATMIRNREYVEAPTLHKIADACDETARGVRVAGIEIVR